MSQQLEHILEAIEAVERIDPIRALHYLDLARVMPGAEVRPALVRIHEIERRCAEELNS